MKKTPITVKSHSESVAFQAEIATLNSDARNQF